MTKISKKNLLINTHFQQFQEKVEQLEILLDDHQGMKGHEIEKLLIEFMKAYLPGKYSFDGNKKLLDIDGNASKEQDIVIWNHNEMPRIFEKSEFFLFETVSACVEVKKTLNSESLREAMINIQQLRQLNHSAKVEKGNSKVEQIHILGGEVEGYQLDHTTRMKDLYNHEINFPPINIIVAYDSSWKQKNTIIQNVEKNILKYKIQPDEVFDLLFIIKSGVIGDWALTMPVDSLPHIPNNISNTTAPFFPFKSNWDLRSKIRFRVRQMYQKPTDKTEEKNQFKINENLTTTNKILSLIEFLSILSRGLDEQIKFKPYQILQKSYSYEKFNLSGWMSQNIWDHKKELNLLSYFLNISQKNAILTFYKKISQLLKTDFQFVGEILFPAAKSISMIVFFNDVHLFYSLFPSDSDSGTLIILPFIYYKKFEKKILPKVHKLTRSSISIEKDLENPHLWAYRVIWDKLKKIIDRKKIPLPNNQYLALEYICDTIQNNYKYFGLEKKSEYSFNEIYDGYYQYYPFWIDETLKRSNNHQAKELIQRMGYYDPIFFPTPVNTDRILDDIKKSVRSRIKSGEKLNYSISCALSNSSPKKFVRALSIIKKLHQRTIKNLYPKYDIKKRGTLYNSLTPTQLKSKLNIIFTNLTHTYSDFISANFPLLIEDFSIPGSSKIVIELKIENRFSINDYPSIIVNFPFDDRNALRDVEIYSQNEVKYLHQERILKINNCSYHNWRRINLDSIIFFNEFPLLNVIYELIKSNLTEYFKKKGIDDYLN